MIPSIYFIGAVGICQLNCKIEEKFENKRNIFKHDFFRFHEILDEDRVYNLSEDGGPKRALLQYQNTENLRIIGKAENTNHMG